MIENTNPRRQRALKAITAAAIAAIFGEEIERATFVSASDLNELDGELVQRGFDCVLLGSRPDLGLELLNRSGVIEAIIPDLYRIVGFGGGEEGHKDLWAHTKVVVRQAPPRLAVRWAALFHDVGKPLTIKSDHGDISFHGHEQLGVKLFLNACSSSVLFPDADIRNRVAQLIELLGDVEAYTPDWTDSAVRRLRGKFESEDLWFDTIDLARADVTTRNKDKKREIRSRMDELVVRANKIIRDDEQARPTIPKGIGHAIINELKVEPGPKVGQLRDLLEGQVRAGRLERERPIGYYVDFLRTYLESPVTIEANQIVVNMQSPRAREAARTLFEATPEAIAEAAVTRHSSSSQE